MTDEMILTLYERLCHENPTAEDRELIDMAADELRIDPERVRAAVIAFILNLGG